MWRQFTGKISGRRPTPVPSFVQIEHVFRLSRQELMHGGDRRTPSNLKVIHREAQSSLPTPIFSLFIFVLSYLDKSSWQRLEIAVKTFSLANNI